jgi:hypothetical protein
MDWGRIRPKRDPWRAGKYLIAKLWPCPAWVGYTIGTLGVPLKKVSQPTHAKLPCQHRC